MTGRIDADPELRALFAEGKMLGVLEVEKADGSTGFLYGFSGLAGGRNRIEGFVPPIFDLLDPDGHFKQEEARIVALTRQIQALSCHAELPSCHAERPSCHAELSEASHRLTALKLERRERSVALQEWIFDQFIVLNARGQRLSIAEVFAREGLVPPGGTGECAAPKLLQFAYLNGLKPIAMGEFWYGASPLGEIRRHGSFYPSCTGKCGPLLRFMLEGLEVEPDPLTAFSPTQVQNRRLGTPASTESSPAVQNRHIHTSTPIKPAAQVQNRHFYTSVEVESTLAVQNRHFCTSEPTESTPEVQNQRPCTPIPIVYEDEALLVIDKPSGLLSVPGRNNPVSALSLLQKEHGPLYPCHRLDMDTSGLMVYAKTVEDQAAMQAQFASRQVRKTYRATLIAPASPASHNNIPSSPRPRNLTPTSSGAPTSSPALTPNSSATRPRDLTPGAHGWIDLPITPDWYDRPRQKVDKNQGKPARTEYEILAVHPDGKLEIRFTPHTGRTHQLRVHAAHPEGLDRPILGDRLYGGHTPADPEPNYSPSHPQAVLQDALPLHLRADTLSFRHPRTGAEINLALN